MSKIIKVHKGGFVHLKDFLGLIDIDKIETYSLKTNKDRTITLKFYDSGKKLVKPHA